MSHGPGSGEWAAALGVRPGDTVQLMADLTRMAWAEHRSGRRFSATAFLDGFVEAVGPGGNVLVPAFNYDLRSGDAFDARKTRSISGALANAALGHPAFRRTSHPLHSFAVAGADADRLCATEHSGSFDERSPFAFLMEKRGVLLAVDLRLDDALTFVHYVEWREGVPYRRMRKLRIHCTDAQGRSAVREVELYAKRMGHVNAFSELDVPLRRAGALQDIDVAGSRALRVDLALAYPAIAHDIRRNGARSIHHFSLRAWFADALRPALRALGLRGARERLSHAARTP